MKSGKWAEDDKAETRIEGSFEEFGELPKERADNDPMSALITDVKDGLRTAEIIEATPALAFRIREIDTLRQTLQSEEQSSKNRNIEVSYIFGATGTGKTSGIYAKHHPHDICRITNYRKEKGIVFDNYEAQDVLVFEEFNSQIPIEDMLNYLDIYPTILPARYRDKVACFTKVYMTSNTPLEQQYLDVQMKHPETWKAFLRRIHNVIEYKHDGTITTKILNERREISCDIMKDTT